VALGGGPVREAVAQVMPVAPPEKAPRRGREPAPVAHAGERRGRARALEEAQGDVQFFMRQAFGGAEGPEALAQLAAARLERLGVASGRELAQEAPRGGAFGGNLFEAQAHALLMVAKLYSGSRRTALRVGAAPARGRLG
jgi:hypothetical protein